MEKEGFKWHGAALPVDKCREALAILGVTDDLDHWIAERKKPAPDWHRVLPRRPDEAVVLRDGGNAADVRCRREDRQPERVRGAALADLGALSDIARRADGRPGLRPVESDEDRRASPSTSPRASSRCGIAEHNAAVDDGALSSRRRRRLVGATSRCSACAEAYNQQRLNDINEANVKLALHALAGSTWARTARRTSSIDYFALLNSTFGWKVFTPADPNQTDRVVRWMATHRGNHALVMGRSKIPVALKEDGTPFFGGDAVFDPTRADRIREGDGLSLVCAGNVLPYALDAWNALAKEGTRVDLVSVAAWSDLSDPDLAHIARHGVVVTVEDHNPKSGLGTWIQARLNDLGLSARVKKMGVTFYSSSGPAKELYALMGLDGPAIAKAVREALSRNR